MGCAVSGTCAPTAKPRRRWLAPWWKNRQRRPRTNAECAWIYFTLPAFGWPLQRARLRLSRGCKRMLQSKTGVGFSTALAGVRWTASKASMARTWFTLDYPWETVLGMPMMQRWMSCPCMVMAFAWCNTPLGKTVCTVTCVFLGPIGLPLAARSHPLLPTIRTIIWGGFNVSWNLVRCSKPTVTK